MIPDYTSLALIYQLFLHFRSFGPALVALFAGNAAPFASLWVFIVGPFAGAALAACTYKALEE